MADRGFTIEDSLTPLGVGLNIPPFLGSRQQMDAVEVVETQQIASLRIHVERAICCVKEYDILAGVANARISCRLCKSDLDCLLLIDKFTKSINIMLINVYCVH